MERESNEKSMSDSSNLIEHIRHDRITLQPTKFIHSDQVHLEQENEGSGSSEENKKAQED